MSGWRVAESLKVLGNEIDQLAPSRSTRSDGTIGDADHAESASDHNPNASGVVCARDFTHDPASGADMHAISRRIVKTLAPALKYVIFNRQIWSRSRAVEGWRRYTGSNAHTRHMHVSVGRGPDGQSTGPYDDTSGWGIADLTEEDTMIIGLRKGDSGSGDKLLRERIKALQALLELARFELGDVDGEYGPKTARAVLAMLRSQGSGIDSGDYISGWVYRHLVSAVIDAKIKAAA